MAKQSVYQAIASGLRDFGYSDVQASMIVEIHEAMERSEEPLPYGIIGMFAKDQLREAKDRGLL